MDTQQQQQHLYFFPTAPPPPTPSLQIPKPTQPHHDPRYYHPLLQETYYYSYFQPMRYASTPASSNPSPSTTLYSTTSSSTTSSSSGGGSTLVLEETGLDVIKKAKENWLSAPSSSSSSVVAPVAPVPDKGCHHQPITVSGSDSSKRSTKRKTIKYKNWMLNPEAATYAPLFSPIDVDFGLVEPDRDEEQSEAQIPPPPPPSTSFRSPPPARFQLTATHSYRRLHPHKPWSEFFTTGCRQNRDGEVSRRYARLIVQSQRWDDENEDDKLLELVHAFVRHAVDVNVDAVEREEMASFARRVGEAFGSADELVVPRSKTKTKKLDERFGELMRETVLLTFLRCWDNAPDNRDAITYPTTQKQPSSSYLTYLTSSLHLCSFIADLYLTKFLSRPDTVGCIRILLYNLSLVDHITAMEGILKRAGTVLWRAAEDLDGEVEDFERQMERVVKVVKDNRHLLVGAALREGMEKGGDGGTRTVGIVERKVEGLVRFVRECRRFVCEGRAVDGVFVPIRPER